MSENFIKLPIPEGKAFDRIETDESGNINVVLKDARVVLGPHQPEYETVYRYVAERGSVLSLNWHSEVMDKGRRDNFNTYTNHDHATADSAYLLAIRKLRRFAHQLNPKGWEKRSSRKWGLYNYGGSIEVYSSAQIFTWLGMPLFHSKEAARQALDALTPEDIAALKTQY